MSLFIGLMSGTSMDGIDAVLVDFADTSCTLRHAHSAAYPADLAARLQAIGSDPNTATLDELGALDVRVAHAFANAVQELLTSAGANPADITAVGSHGQTVLHRPDGDTPFSLQLGEPGTLAARTGLTVVADFRNADIALGGQGAPLVPAFHRWAFGQQGEYRAVVNVGGIANVTLLDPHGATTGFDTGPGNVLLDQWCREHRQKTYDTDGEWAAGGTVQPALLRQLSDDPYFARAAPKSTGSDYFNLNWLLEQLRMFGHMPDPADVQATLCELTAVTIAAAVPDSYAVAICGGGAANRDLMQRLGRLLQPRNVVPTSAWGVDPEWVEAVAFAWLARQRLRGEPSNVPSVTGARAAISLGGVFLPPA